MRLIAKIAIVILILLLIPATRAPASAALSSLRVAVHNATGPSGPCGQ